MKQTVSIRVNPVLWKATKTYCAEHGKTMSQLVEELLLKELRKKGVKKSEK